MLSVSICTESTSSAEVAVLQVVVAVKDFWAQCVNLQERCDYLSLRYFFAIPLGLLGAFGMLCVFRITAAGESDMVGLVAIPAIVSLFSAFGIGNARSGLWLTISAIVGGLVLLFVTAAAFVLGAAIYSR